MTENRQPLAEEISHRAYGPYLERAGEHGHDVADWVNRSGVVCLFCGRRTPLPASAGPRTFEGRRVLIIRCRVCGKEAPYEASRISEFQEKTNGANSARAAGKG